MAKGKPTKKASRPRKKAEPTVRSTGGPGFDFEDQVGAWLISKMLLGEPIPGVGGSGQRISSQTAALKWTIDDLLVSARNEQGAVQLALSAKGNQQVNSAGLPVDFVRRAWEQAAQTGGPFSPGRDGLALVTRGFVAAFEEPWAEVKNAARGSTPALGLARIAQNPRQKKVFQRLIDAGPAGTTHEQALALAASLHVLPVDFHLDHSERTDEAVGKLRSLLVSGDIAEAKRLWEELIGVFRELRLSSGSINLPEIWARLGSKFGLLNHPDFTGDWRRLDVLTASGKLRVETAFTNGFKLERGAVEQFLADAFAEWPISVVFGDSGVGKSSLVKVALDRRLPNWKQVWLGPAELVSAIDPARRGALGIAHELSSILASTTSDRNVLVFDASERIGGGDTAAVRAFVEAFAAAELSPDGRWRLVLITQTQAVAGGVTNGLLGEKSFKPLEIEKLTDAQVRQALRASGLQTLAAHPEAVSALTNLRTLGWLASASAVLGGSAAALTSHTAVADCLWRYWTEDRTDIKRLMMRLGEREASFERSFPITSLEAGDTTAFESRPAHLPLRLDTEHNRVEFEHDLAADWSRFQYLKQFVGETERWVALAENPLWIGALRMLGQYLLCQPDGASTKWDVAFARAEAAGNSAATDVLLDALFLDPAAGQFLTDRAAFLFENHGKRLHRLLQRFWFAGTVSRSLLGQADDMSLHMEATYRTPIIGLWMPVLRFLEVNREEVGRLALDIASKVCETWLSNLPTTTQDGQPFPLRAAAAELALRCAQETEADKLSGVMHTGSASNTYTAPFAGAPDLPQRVEEWALEQAGRRPVPRAVADRAAELRAARKLPVQHATQRQKSLPMVHMGPRALPPWPLGPQRRIDRDFRKACVSGTTLGPLMRKSPAVAAEVILAVLIDDNPHEEFGRVSLDDDVGLEYDVSGSPTAFWKSPLFQFFAINADAALGATIQLINFCTERWAKGTGVAASALPRVVIQLDDGSVSEFVGNARVYNWVQGESHGHGQLNCALDALERWFIAEIEKGADLVPAVERILREGRSLALLAVLVNLAKAKPDLLDGPLAVLFTDPFIILLDERRGEQRFWPAYQWAKAGEVIFEFAKAWALADHRKTTLRAVVTERILAGKPPSARAKALIAQWVVPADNLNLRALAVEFDDANYAAAVDPATGQQSLSVAYPPELRADADEQRLASETEILALTIPRQCEQILASSSVLDARNAQHVFGVLGKMEARAEEAAKSGEAGVDPMLPVVVIAAVLLVKGGDWLADNDAAGSKVRGIIAAEIEAIASSHAELAASRHDFNDRLRFVAYAVAHLWLQSGQPDPAWDRAILTLMTSGNQGAFGAVMAAALSRRAELGGAWWRLLLAGSLWSGLSMLSPRYGDAEAVSRRWGHWLGRLRRMPLSDEAGDVELVRVERVRIGIHRLLTQRWQAAPKDELGRGKFPPLRQLDDHILEGAFGWLVDSEQPPQRYDDADITLLRQLWSGETQRLKDRGKEEDGELDLPGQLGDQLVSAFARLTLQVPVSDARSVWESVLGLGPGGHYTIRRFLSAFFMLLNEPIDLSAFVRVWREMVEYGLADSWAQTGRWYRKREVMAELLGLTDMIALKSVPAAATAVQAMRDLFERWAVAHLVSDEDNIEKFAYLLTLEVGRSLRLDGIKWIHRAMDSRERRWYRDGIEDTLTSLIDKMLVQDAQTIRQDLAARNAVVAIAADLASLGVATALALQERLRQLR